MRELLGVNQLVFWVNYPDVPEVGEPMVRVILAVGVNKFRFTAVIDKANLTKLQFDFGLREVKVG